MASVLMLSLNACSKINICGQESKLYGTWVITDYSIGDSSVALFDPATVPSSLPVGSELRPLLSFQENGTLLFIQFLDTSEVSSYRMDRYEKDCLIYSDLFEYRWVINKLSNSAMDIASWTLAGPDSLVTTTYTLEKK